MKIRIGAIDYTVKEEPDAVRVLDDGTEYDGLIDYTAATISVTNNCAPQVKRQILLHEVIHGVLKHAGQRHSDEMLVQALGYGLLDLIQDNPDFIEFLMGDE